MVYPPPPPACSPRFHSSSPQQQAPYGNFHSPHSNNEILSGPYQEGLSQHESAIEVTTVINEQLNSLENLRSQGLLALDADENENGDDNDSDDAFKVAGKPNNGVGTNNRSKDEISIADSARRRSKRRKR